MVALAVPAAAQDAGLTPEQLGEIFCISRLAGDLGALEGLMTVGLEQAIADAEAQNSAIAAASPDEKPPLGDGIPWAAYPDRPSSCAIGEPQWMMDEARLEITYEFDNAPDAGFSDTLLLQLVERTNAPKAWRIDNVAFANGGDLRTALLSAFMN
jgi:hypothetical protein